MMRLGFSLCGVLAALLPSFGLAQSFEDAGARGFLTGEDLRERCRSEKESARFYIMGVLDGYLAGREGNAALQGILCIPDSVETTDVFETSCGYVEDHADRGHMQASYSIILALDAKWACKSQ